MPPSGGWWTTASNLCRGSFEGGTGTTALLWIPGRGPKGETWKLEESLWPFLQLAVQLLSETPLFFLINSYTTGLQPAVLSYLLRSALGTSRGGKVESAEIGLPVTGNGLILPCGAAGRWTRSDLPV